MLKKTYLSIYKPIYLIQLYTEMLDVYPQQGVNT